jgi:hypothetical protein
MPLNIILFNRTNNIVYIDVTSVCKKNVDVT